jgi:hypothetical protein
VVELQELSFPYGLAHSAVGCPRGGQLAAQMAGTAAAKPPKMLALCQVTRVIVLTETFTDDN